MLFNIGDAEMTVGELTSRGCYLGSNVSYNVSKLTQNGYLAADRSEHDRRSVRVKLTDKGRQLRDAVSAMYQRHVEMLGRTSITEDDLEGATTMLERLERFWSEASNPYRRGVVLSDTAGE